ncbi:MAG: hypothetical protein IPL79_03635 [Myxococcales bacterium]|nr:hypothetical protein [Myxococcales bacterium]
MKPVKQCSMWSGRALVGVAVVLGAACAKAEQEPAPAAPQAAVQAPSTIAVPGAPAAAATAMPAAANAAPTTDALPTALPTTTPPHAAADPALGTATLPSSGLAVATSDPMFTISLTNPGHAAPGATVTAKVTALPGKGYKINKEFPATLQLDPTAGVAFSPARIERSAALVDNDHELTFGVQMSATAKGDYAVKGLLKFAMCDDANCMPKKQAIALDLHVK